MEQLRGVMEPLERKMKCKWREEDTVFFKDGAHGWTPIEALWQHSICSLNQLHYTCLCVLESCIVCLCGLNPILSWSIFAKKPRIFTLWSTDPFTTYGSNVKLSVLPVFIWDHSPLQFNYGIVLLYHINPLLEVVGWHENGPKSYMTTFFANYHSTESHQPVVLHKAHVDNL